MSHHTITLEIPETLYAELAERAAQAQLPAIRAALARFRTSPVALTPPQPALR